MDRVMHEEVIYSLMDLIHCVLVSFNLLSTNLMMSLFYVRKEMFLSSISCSDQSIDLSSQATLVHPFGRSSHCY